MNRRSFFRSLGLAAGAAVVPLPAKPKAPVVVPIPKSDMAVMGPCLYASNIIYPGLRDSLYGSFKFDSSKELRSPFIYGA